MHLESVEPIHYHSAWFYYVVLSVTCGLALVLGLVLASLSHQLPGFSPSFNLLDFLGGSKVRRLTKKEKKKITATLDCECLLCTSALHSSISHHPLTKLHDPVHHAETETWHGRVAIAV